jgi:hypothetical protein
MHLWPWKNKAQGGEGESIPTPPCKENPPRNILIL